MNGISEINQLFDDILIIWPVPVYVLTLEKEKLKNKIKCKYYGIIPIEILFVLS